MNYKLPSQTYGSDLRAMPIDTAEWEAFVSNLEQELNNEAETTKRLRLYELLGVSTRILYRSDESEQYMKKALELSSTPTKKIQNLIRLAHTYQYLGDFPQAKCLFDKARLLFQEHSISDILLAAYHQHLGKYYFDQEIFDQAHCEFQTALEIRQKINAPEDQLESTLIAIRETERRLQDSHN